MQKGPFLVAVVGVILAAASMASADLADGLMALYRFEDPTNLGKDETGVHPGVVMGTTPIDGQHLEGKVGTAMNFDHDSGNYIDLADGFADFTGGITIAAWVYAESFAPEPNIIRLANGTYPVNTDTIWLSRMPAGDALRWEFRDTADGTSGQISMNAFTPGAWQFIVTTCTGGTTGNATMATYLNGALQEPTYTQASVPSNVTRRANTLGKGYSPDDGFWDGMMDEVGIWNRALSQAEVTELYNNGNGQNFMYVRDKRLSWNRHVGNWGDLTDPVNHPGRSHWSGGEAEEIPDITADGLANEASILRGEVTVAADHGAMSMEMLWDTLVTINPTRRLKIIEDVNMKPRSDLVINGTLDAGALTSEGTVTLGAGAVLRSPEVSLTEAMVTTGDATFEGGGSVAGLALAPGSTFTKRGRGKLTLTGESASTMDATNTLHLTEGELSVGTIGGAKIVLNGGIFSIEDSSGAGQATGRLIYGFYKDAPPESLQNIDDGVDNNDTDGLPGSDSNGGLFDLAVSSPSTWPSGVIGKEEWTGELWLEGTSVSGLSERYCQMWSGAFTAPTSGTYEFYVHGDDFEILWLDLNQNHDFEASNGEDVSRSVYGEEPWNTPHTETVDLVGGQTYDFALAHNDGIAGDFLHVTIKPPGGEHQRINPSAPEQAGWWPSEGEKMELSIDMSDTSVSLTGDAKLNALTVAEAVFGSLAYDAPGVTLTTAGASGGMRFLQTTFTHADARLHAKVDTALGTLVNSAGVTLTVMGPHKALVFDGETNPMGDLTLKLVNGGLTLSDATLAPGVTFDGLVEVTGHNTLTAGKFLAGQPGPQTVTVGGAEGIMLNDGVLTLATRDDYTLVLGGPLVANGGDIRFAPGAKVDVSAGGGARNMMVTGPLGEITGLPNLTLSGVIKIRPSGEPVDYPYDNGVNTIEVGDDDSHDGEVTLSGVTSASGGGLTIVRSTVTVPSVAALPGGNLLFGQNDSDRIAVLQGEGKLARDLGTGAGMVQWAGHGGFAGKGGRLTVGLNEWLYMTLGVPEAPVVWGDPTGDGGLNGKDLQFGSPTADAPVEFTSNLDLGNATRRFQVADNPDSTTDKLILSGDIEGNGGLATALRFNELSNGPYATGREGDVNWDLTHAPLTELTGTNTYTQKTVIHHGAVFGVDGAGIPRASGVEFDDNNPESETVWLSNGVIDRNIGDQPGEIWWEGSGGFAARGGDLTVTLEGGATLSWTSESMGFRGRRLHLGSRYADSVLTLTNPISGSGASCLIVLGDNPDSPDDRVVVTGDWTGMRDAHFRYRGGSVRRFAGRIDFGTPDDPVVLGCSETIRVSEGADLRLYHDVTGSRRIEAYHGSRAIIHGDVSLSDPIRAFEGSIVEIHGDLTWGRGSLETRGYDDETGTIGSEIRIHGNATSSGDGRVQLRDGGTLWVGGSLTMRTPRLDVRGACTLSVGLDPPTPGQDDLIISDLDVSEGGTARVGGDIVSVGRLIMSYEGSRLDVGGNASFIGDIRLSGSSRPEPGEKGHVLNVGGSLIKSDFARDFLITSRSKVTTGLGSRIECRSFLVHEGSEVTIDGDVELWGAYSQNGAEDSTVNRVVITGNLKKMGTTMNVAISRGSYLDASNTEPGTVVEARYFDVSNGGTWADFGRADVTVRDRLTMSGGGMPYCHIGGDLTITRVGASDAIRLYDGTLVVGGRTTAHRIHVWDNAVFQSEGPITVHDELYVAALGTLSPGAITLEGDLALSPGATFLWETGDRIDVLNGTVTLDGSILDLATAPRRPHTILTCPPHALSGQFATVTGLPDGFSVEYDTVGGAVTIVPEPCTVALLSMGALALLRRKRRLGGPQ